MDKGKSSLPKFGDILPLGQLSAHLKDVFVSTLLCLISLLLVARRRIIKFNDEWIQRFLIDASC